MEREQGISLVLFSHLIELKQARVKGSKSELGVSFRKVEKWQVLAAIPTLGKSPDFGRLSLYLFSVL